MSRIGFVGLGNMGLPMAQNLLKAGHQVEGVDVNPAAIGKLKAAGHCLERHARSSCPFSQGLIAHARMPARFRQP